MTAALTRDADHEVDPLGSPGMERELGDPIEFPKTAPTTFGPRWRAH